MPINIQEERITFEKDGSEKVRRRGCAGVFKGHKGGWRKSLRDQI